ncbi:MAG: hypothetical protein H6558_01940 [Lewinellaceae bacterium]|nr:hypothetical protein [Lewinellaceae bacterium]MCB9286823.1 hypothetical protein [Lewinellaceae bacterium]
MKYCSSSSLAIGFFLLLTLALSSSCEKWALDRADFPEVATLGFEAGQNPAEGYLYGEISGLTDNSFVNNYGHVWSLATDPAPTVEGNLGQSLFERKGNGTIQSELSGLVPGKTYSYRAYIVYNNQVIYGEAREFSTEPVPVVFRIDSILNYQPGQFTVNVFSTISNLPVGLKVKSYGLTWSTDSLPEITTDTFVFNQAFVVSPSNVKIQFESEIVLPAGDSYFRPFIEVGEEIYYGESRRYHLGDIWTRKADFGGGSMWFAYGFSIGQKGYLGKQGSCWEYAPITDSWTQMAGFIDSVTLRSSITFSIGLKGYLVLGNGDFWEFDPQANIWTRKADFEGQPRGLAIGFSIGDYGYFGAGIERNDFWKYDPQTNSWTPKADFPGEESISEVSFSIGQKGYVLTRSSAFWEYDPQTNSWARKADCNCEVNQIGFSIGEKGYIGMVAYHFNEEFYEYDPLSDEWEQKRNFGGGKRYFATGFSIGEKGYIGTGQSLLQMEGTIDLWEYTPD